MTTLATLWCRRTDTIFTLQLIAGDRVRLTQTSSMGWLWVHSKEGVALAGGGSASKTDAMEQVEAYLLSRLSAHQKLAVHVRAQGLA
jgi:hypothetical protein